MKLLITDIKNSSSKRSNEKLFWIVFNNCPSPQLGTLVENPPFLCYTLSQYNLATVYTSKDQFKKCNCRPLFTAMPLMAYGM